MLDKLLKGVEKYIGGYLYGTWVIEEYIKWVTNRTNHKLSDHMKIKNFCLPKNKQKNDGSKNTTKWQSRKSCLW